MINEFNGFLYQNIWELMAVIRGSINGIVVAEKLYDRIQNELYRPMYMQFEIRLRLNSLKPSFVNSVNESKFEKHEL